MTNGILFTKVELKAYPLLPLLETGLRVICLKQESYEGLKGTITEIRYGNKRETENNSIVEIIVDFDELLHQSVDESHPHLNGTSIGQVVMCEETLGIYFDANPPRTLDNKIVCESCYESLDMITETQNDHITWNLTDGEWLKTQSGDSDGKRCHLCDYVFDLISEEILPY